MIEDAGGVQVELDRCTDGGEAACWYTYTDADLCPDGDNIGIAIDRRSATAPANPIIEATCFLE